MLYTSFVLFNRVQGSEEEIMKYIVYGDPGIIDEEFNDSPFSLKKDLKGISKEVQNKILENIANDLYNAENGKPLIKLYVCTHCIHIFCIKLRVADEERDNGKSGGYRAIVLVNEKDYYAFLLHLYRHSHGEKDNISKQAKNRIVKIVDSYYDALSKGGYLNEH